jgi:SAM-dependent methyltransferase
MNNEPMTKTVHEQYAQSFEKFLAHTDEKDVFVRKFSGYIDRYQPGSLLDIGAGNGSLALPIAQQVERYVAVEHNPKYAAKLRDTGLTVIQQAFPAAIDGSFDLVIMSHVISYEAGNHMALIRSAWDLVADGGNLLIVTHRGGADDDWSRLLTRVGMGRFEKYAGVYDEIMSTLQQRGVVEVRKIVTTLDTAIVEDMLEAMAFVASGGRLDTYDEFMSHTSELVRVLNTNYKTEKGYSFPFSHIFIATQKA